MPTTCLVVGCKNRLGRGSVSFYSVPNANSKKYKASHKIKNLLKRRRKMWIRALKRELTEKQLKNQRICGNHFISGRPAELHEETSPDWVPSQNLGYNAEVMLKSTFDPERYERFKKRVFFKELIEEKCSESHEEYDTKNLSLPNIEIATSEIVSLQEMNKSEGKKNHGNWAEEGILDEILKIDTDVETDFTALRQTRVDTGIQTDLTSLQLTLYFNEMNATNSLILQLRNKLNIFSLQENAFKDNDDKTKYLTGLKSSKILFIIHETIAPYLFTRSNTKFSTFQQLILTLMRLRLNLDFKYLANRFEVCPATISDYFHRCLDVLYTMLQGLVYWPCRETLHATMPSCFQESFGNRVAVIIDCFEIFIENPSNLYTGAQCWSNYKHHKTVKLLIGITPQGTICFISDGFGGRISDKAITEMSGILKFLRPFDVILADRGFRIEEAVNQVRAELKIPAFTKGKSQLHPIELEETRQTAHVRIHVERVIGSLRQKYRILSGILTTTNLATTQGDLNEIDKLFHVCCSLYNLNPSIVSQA